MQESMFIEMKNYLEASIVKSDPNHIRQIKKLYMSCVNETDEDLMLHNSLDELYNTVSQWSNRFASNINVCLVWFGLIYRLSNLLAVSGPFQAETKNPRPLSTNLVSNVNLPYCICIKFSHFSRSL